MIFDVCFFSSKDCFCCKKVLIYLMVFLFIGIKCFLLFLFMICIIFWCKFMFFMVSEISFVICSFVVYSNFSMVLLCSLSGFCGFGVFSKVLICVLFKFFGKCVGSFGFINSVFGLLVCIFF